MRPLLFRLCIIALVLLLVTACGPSAEEIATMTAAAWTATPSATPTPTLTPTPTPVPYDLTVTVLDSNGNPVVGAAILFSLSGNGEPVLTDESGQFSWFNLSDPDGELTITAQGYLDAVQTVMLERGLNEVSVTIERDPYGLLPSTACLEGETLLWMEDFQNGKSTFNHNGASQVAPIVAAVDEVGNLVLIHDSSVNPNDYSTYLTHNDQGEFLELEDAVLRLRFMITQETDWSIQWQSARPTQFGGITTSETVYFISFNTGRHINIMRGIWNSSGERVRDIGKPGLLDTVLILEPNVWHYLEISTYMGQLQVWLDGEMAVDVIDEVPLPPGGFGIQGQRTGINYYDAISVCGLSAPFISMPAPVPVP